VILCYSRKLDAREKLSVLQYIKCEPLYKLHFWEMNKPKTVFCKLSIKTVYM